MHQQFGPQLGKAAPVKPNDTAYAVERERGREIGLSHLFECNWVLEMPVDRIAAVYCEPCCEKRSWPKSPLALKDDAKAPRRGEVGEKRHDKTNGNVPIWRLVKVRTSDEQSNPDEQRAYFPWPTIFFHKPPVGHSGTEALDDANRFLLHSKTRAIPSHAIASINCQIRGSTSQIWLNVFM